MGCFPGCFGRRKNRRRQQRRESFQPRLNRISEGSSEGSTKDVHLNLKVTSVKEVPKLPEGSVKDVHLNLKAHTVEEAPKISEESAKDDHLNLKVSTVEEVPKVSECSAKDDNVNLKAPTVEEVPKISVIPIIEICDKAEEKHSPSPSLSPTRKRVTFDSKVKTYEHIAVEESVELFEEKKEEVKSKLARCSSEGSDITSNSSGSYPSNHRYQNCRESDDEEEEDVADCCESELEDIDDDGGLLHEDYYDDDDNYEYKLQNWDKEVYTEEIADNVLDIEKIEEKTNASARDRSGYVNAVLNPIENLSQWKAVKSKGRTTTQTRKENAKASSFFSLEEPKSRDETKKQRRTQEEVVAVDASLSTWLSTSQTTTSGCSSVFSLDVESTKYSKTVQSHDERPVLCALTAEDIKQFSATNSPRKSPSRSPESPIIGTVGGYWNSHSMATSKYREV